MTSKQMENNSVCDFSYDPQTIFFISNSLHLCVTLLCYCVQNPSTPSRIILRVLEM